MAVYAVSDSLYTQTQPNDADTWERDALAKYERRLELGRHVNEAARQWLCKPSQLPRLTFWLELLHNADIDGTCDPTHLHSWTLFDTPRKREYLLAMLEHHQLVRRLDGNQLQVLA